MPAPIALFTYRRPEHTKRTLEALLRNDLANASSVYVFSDGPKSDADRAAVMETRAYLQTVKGFRSFEIIEQESNLGLAESIIRGVTRVLSEHERLIVLEDDIVSAPHFLAYMNHNLELYETDAAVASIHAYVYPCPIPLPETFFIRGADCWGWATWARAWKNFEPNGEILLKQIKARGLARSFDFDGTYPYVQMLEDQITGKNNSWAIRWNASAFLKKQLTLYPGKALVKNIGFDASGTHATESTQAFEVTLSESWRPNKKIPLRENAYARYAFKCFFKNKILFPGPWLRKIFWEIVEKNLFH